MPINIFGFQLGKQTPEDPKKLEPLPQPVKSPIPPDGDDGATVIDFVGGHGFALQLANFDSAARTDTELIAKYRQMYDHAEVQTAIDDIVNQAIVLNEKTDPVGINLDKSKIPASVKKKVKEEFDEILRLLKFNTKGNDLFKRWYIDGRLYLQILMDEKKQKQGIVELRMIDPTKIKKIRQIEREVATTGVKFIKSIREYYIYTADDFVGNGIDTVNYRYAAEGIILPSDSVVHINSGFVDQTTKKVLGYLHKAIKPLNQLRMLEDAVVVYRISRAPERRIFYIDVGSLPKNKSEQYLREIMQRYRNKLVYDTATGELRDEKRHMSMLEDFWMPRREGGKGTEVQTLPGGQNLGEMQDVDFFLKKLYYSLHVPPSRFREDSGFNMGRSAEISRDEVRFTKFVNRLQSRFSDMFLQLLRVQLLSKNIMTEDEWKEYSYDISFDYATDQYFAELKENEMNLSRLTTLREVDPYIGKFFSMRWVRRNVLQMSDDEIDTMKKEMEEDKTNEPNAMSGAMGGAFGSEIPPEAPAAPEGEPEESIGEVGAEELSSDLGVEPEGGKPTLEIPDIEGIDLEGQTGATGEGGMSDEDFDELLSSFTEAYPQPVRGKDSSVILSESVKPTKKLSPMSSKVLHKVLAKRARTQDFST